MHAVTSSKESLPGSEMVSGLFAGDGEMAALMRAKDWEATALGPVSGWSLSLRMMVRFLLANRFPLLLWWGPEYVSIYNDAYRPILGNKHPLSLGQPVRDCWAEIWHILRPLIDTPFNGGPATWMEDIQLEIARYDFVEETHFTVAYSPVPDETAPTGIGGVLATVHEISEKVVGERRIALLRDLGARTGEAKSAVDACSLAAEVVAKYALDIPFAGFYLLNEGADEAVLAASVGIEGIVAPGVVPFRGRQAGPWPFAEVARSHEAVAVEDLAARLPRVPPGPWSDPPKCAVVLPIHANRAGHLAGILVAGVSSRLRLDDQYRSFLEFATTQVATAIATATAYEEERRRAEALAEIDRAKTAFFSNASHEFRTPLTLMLGPLEDALHRPEGAEAGGIERRELELVHRNGLRLLKLVNTLLDFSRIEAGRFQAVYEPTDVAAYTAELASTFRSAMERAELDFTIDCPPLPSPVHVDHDMWEKIVLNLLSNAFKFTVEGSVRISVRASPDGSTAILTVSDTGIGIPEGELPRLFERFHRIEGQRGRSQEGTGIGLALVAELVRLHGGKIDVASGVGRGSDFTVVVPIGSAHLPKESLGPDRALASTSIRAEAFVEEALRWLPGEDPESEVATPGERLPDPPAVVAGDQPRRHRILLADDNADMRDYVRRLLYDRYDVETANDGETALATARRHPPDLVLSDVMMPKLDGFGLLRALRDDPELAGIPVLLLSARAGEEAKVEGLEAGADDYLTKPFNARELLARVASNLELASARRHTATVLREEARRLEVLNHTATALAAEIELERLVQAVTDAATELTGAKFGAFFYNVLDEAGESYLLYTLSGASREDFAGFPQPRNTAVFAPTFNGEGVVRSADIRKDPRYGRNAPNKGPPAGHLPVVSYLAVPVVSPSREVLGGLFFAHPEPDRFSEQHELIVAGIASQAAIAFEKARLYDASRKAEAELRRLNETLEQRVSTAVDDRMKAEAALRQAQKMEAIGQLTGGVAHDFNNLLQVVIGNLDTLQRRIDDVMPTRADFISRPLTAATRGAERAANLTQRLLAFSRRQPLTPKPIEVNRLVGGMSELLRRTLGETVEIETVLSGGLWHVSADSNQLESAILNLAVNARDAMPAGGKLTIETANAALDEAYTAEHDEVRPGQYVMLAISDTGTGMTKEVADAAFDPFFTTKALGHGTGLGLSQVYGFVKQSNGHVKIYSEPGEGTTVRIYLPRLRGRAPAANDEPTARSLPAGRSSERILLVEDDELVRDLNVETLRDLGYDVVVAADGVEALRQLELVPNIRLLFTDVGLPGSFNGRQLADRALSLRPELKILFTTGYAQNAIMHQGRLDAGVELITKPFTAAALARKVRELLDVSEAQSPQII